ncbi:MAG TPA: hypothetical protein VE463_04565 [Blastococcus sp.]|jgi:hypothetical protein|nr:hypothetical protein [Blastococcus sp.]
MDEDTVAEDRRTGSADVLASWRDGPTREAVVARVCGEDGAPAVPVEQRVAVFDNDGTLKVFAAGPLAAYDGMSVEEFEQRSEAFLRSASHPTLGRSYFGCTYRPMAELLDYLTAHGFTTYIVSGGGRDFMRPVSYELYRVPRERVIGSTVELAYAADDAGGTITHTPVLDYLDDGPQKPIRSWSRIGRRPLLSAGNSNGDSAVLDFSRYAGLPFLRLLVLHDDEDRELAYTAGSERAREQAGRDGWTVVSMKDDWDTVF